MSLSLQVLDCCQLVLIVILGKQKLGFFFPTLHPADTVLFLIWSCSNIRNYVLGASLVVQWLRLCASKAGGMGSIPGGGTKIPHDAQHDQRKKIIKDKIKSQLY